MVDFMVLVGEEVREIINFLKIQYETRVELILVDQLHLIIYLNLYNNHQRQHNNQLPEQVNPSFRLLMLNLKAAMGVLVHIEVQQEITLVLIFQKLLGKKKVIQEYLWLLFVEV